jgi:flagellar assembly factor FliW
MTGRGEDGSGAAPTPVLVEMIEPLIGYAEHRSLTLVRYGSEISELQVTDGSGLAFVVVAPSRLFPDYTPQLDACTVAEQLIGDASDMLLLVVVAVGYSLAESTANLRAPILVNVRTRRAAQLVLDDASLQLRAPLRAA